MSFEKLVKIGRLTEKNTEDNLLYENAYNNLIELFMKMLDSTGESIKGRSTFQVDEIYFNKALEAAKTLNALGRKFEISLGFPEESKKDISMVATLIGNCTITGKMRNK